MRLHYASAGERGKPLLIFLHGFPEFWFAWHAQLQAFGDRYFAVAPDLRGFNLSGMPKEVSDYRPKLITQDIEQLVAYLGYQRCVMVAHDWGGAIAWNIAISRSGLLDRLIIINATHPYAFAKALANDPEQQQASTYMNWLRASGSEQALAKDDFRVMEQLMLGMGRPSDHWFDAATRQRYHASWARGLSGGVNYYRATPLYPPTDEDPGAGKLSLNPEDFRCHVPVRVIWGMQDKALLPQLLDPLPELIDDLIIERLPEATHWVVHEQPERINQLIERFLVE
ncbi:MAG: alpha/beta hydrolase [Oxalobacteraceae bacterium]|nr:alpha/beta hydrolase [Oxalobacteraceae bacterium]